MILIDHIELYPSLFSFFTGEGRLYASAAEGFFFLSGTVVGMVYRRRLAQGLAYAFKRLWRRAAELYVISVALTLLFTAAAILTHQWSIKYGLPTNTHWSSLIANALLLHYTFGWADFLSRFAILTFIAPFAIYLLRRGDWRILLSLSFLGWFFKGSNFIVAWQAIFILAIVTGYYWQEINQYFQALKPALALRLRRTLMIGAGVTFGFSYLSLYLMSYLQNTAVHLPAWLNHFVWSWNNFDQIIWRYCDKWTLGPGRMAFFLIWFSALYLLVERYQLTIRKYSRDWLLLLGQNSLFVYISHAFIVFAFKLFIPAQTSIWQNFLITAMALLSLAGVMALRAAHRGELNLKPFSDFYLLPTYKRDASVATDAE